MSYKIFRSYFEDSKHPTEVIVEGLTLEEAQAHCGDSETSSKTCTEAEGVARTERCGPWFDGYDEE